MKCRLWPLPLIALLVLSSAGLVAATPDWAGADTVEVKLTDFAFTPATLNLHHGKPYRLHLVNAGSGGHNFSARSLFENSTIDPADQASLKNGAVEVAKGGTRDVRFIPVKPGSYKIKCTHFLHSGFGMKGRALVD